MIKVDKEKATECDEVCWNSLGWCEMGRHFHPGCLALTSSRGSDMYKDLMEVMESAK